MAKISSKKILVTGGAGFIGSEFVRQSVKRGYKTIVLDSLTYAGDLARLKEVKGKYKFYKANICNKNQIEKIFIKEKPNYVLHFAAATHVDRSIKTPVTFIETNIRGTQVLLDATRKIKIEKFIHISTDEVYGEIKRGCFCEHSPFSPNSPYAASKAAADMLVKAYQRTYGLPVIIVRPSNNYGPWQYPEKLIPVVILSALRGNKIPVYGKGVNVREWLYVSDCVDALFTVLKKGKIGEVYNIGSGLELKNLNLVNLICQILEKIKPSDSCNFKVKTYNSLIAFVRDRPGHDLRYSLNSDKISKELGWRPKTKVKEGLTETARWFVNNREWCSAKRSFKIY